MKLAIPRYRSCEGKRNATLMVVEQRVVALKADLKRIHEAQKRSIKAAKEFRKRDTGAAAQPTKSDPHTMDVKKNAKVSKDKLFDMQKQVPGSTKSADNALRRLTKPSKRVKLLGEEAQILESQHSKTVKARVLAVADLDGRLIKVRTRETRERMLYDRLDLLKRHESTNCNTKVTIR